MYNEINILSPCGMLGYGFPVESFMRGLKENLHGIVVDAGSTDAGPHKLGAGVPIVSRRATKKDLEVIIQNGLPRKIPIVIGSAGGAGAKPHVDWTLGIVKEILHEADLKAKIAVIWTDFEKEYIVEANKRGKIKPLSPNVKPLTEAIILETENIVAQMGHEPILEALENGSDIIVCGRAYDPSPFAAIGVYHKKDLALSYHLGKILECGALCAEPGTTKDSILGKIGDGYFTVKSLNPLRKCSPTSVAAHTFYEKEHPYILHSSGDSKNPKYAFTAAGDIAELDYIFDMAFGIDKDWLKKKDGTLEYAKVSEKEKEKLTFYNKLYKEGLIDPQYITKKWDTKEKAFYDGEAAVIVGTAGKVIDIYNGKMKQVNGKDAELVVLPPAKGEGQGYGPTDVTKEARGIAISSQSEHKEIAFKILDYLASPKGQMFDRLGFEGEHYKVVDGEIALDEKYYNEWYSRFWEPKVFDPEKPLKTPLLSEPATESQKLVQKHYSENNNVIIPEELVASKDAIDNLYKEYATDMITGKRPIDDFDKFVDEWKQAGGEQITDFVNEK